MKSVPIFVFISLILIISCTRTETKPSTQFVSVNTNEIPWRVDTIHPTLRWDVKDLFTDPETGIDMALVRYPAGIVNPWHTHPHGHGMYVLEGKLVTSRGTYGPGTFIWFPEGEVMEHGASSEGDALFLFVSNKPFSINYVKAPPTSGEDKKEEIDKK